jgi:hypothetical protein
VNPFTVTFLVIAAVLALWIAGYLWFLGELKPPRRVTRLPAGAARARWHALLSACRRSRPGSTSWGRTKTPALAPRAIGHDGEGEGRAFHGLNHAHREPTRLATGDERRDARLDYAPAPPFAGCLSDDTIERGMKAVQ